MSLLPFSAMKAVRMRRPSVVRIGMFCRFGSDEASRPVEVAASAALTDRLDMSLSYTWLDAENPDGSVEVRRPEHEALLRLGYLMPNDRTRLNLEVQHVAGLFDSDFTAASLGANVVELQDYTLVNVGFSHEVTDDIQVYGRIHNVTDESYEELDGYSTQGRTAFFGVTANF